MQESSPSVGFLALELQKPVTAMPVISSDVQQYMICEVVVHVGLPQCITQMRARARAHCTYTYIEEWE